MLLAGTVFAPRHPCPARAGAVRGGVPLCCRRGAPPRRRRRASAARCQVGFASSQEHTRSPQKLSNALGPAVQEAAAQPSPRVAVEGDIVSLRYVCRDEAGTVVDESPEDDPVTFEVGAGEAVGNPLYQAFDGVVRGMTLGDATSIEAQGGEWRRELLFNVPVEHPEVQRLQGRYRSQGGLKQGMLVELANGATALVAALDEATVRLDANNMMAGKKRVFELTLLSVEPPASDRGG